MVEKNPLAESFRTYYAKFDDSVTTDVSKWPEASIGYVFAYGLTQMADAASAIPTTHVVEGRRVAMEGEELTKAQAAARKAIMARLAELAKGNVPAGGGGGAPLTDLVRATRHVAKDFLVANGWKAGAAEKAVTKDTEAAFATLCKAKKADVTDEAVAAAWAKHIAKPAQTLADAWAKARAATGELEL